MPEVRGAEIEYIDFEVEIVGTGRDYSVAVLRSGSGEVRLPFRPPFPPEAIRDLWTEVQFAIDRGRGPEDGAPPADSDRMRDHGSRLMESLLSGDVRSLWDVTRERAIERGQRLRLKLRIQPPELAALPWELLYERRRGDYLSLMRNVSIVRYAENVERVPPPEVQAPLRILGLTALPSDLQVLDVQGEQQRVDDALRTLQGDGLVELVWLPGQTWRDLHDAMSEGPWHVLHYIGHGHFDAEKGEGSIALIGEDGRADHVHATQLGRLLDGHLPLRLVVLNSCEGARGNDQDIFSSCAATLVRRGISAVLAMQYEIGDDAAIEFSRRFYTGIGRNEPIEAAVSEARIAMSMYRRGSLEWAAPVLHLRSEDGRLFRLPSPEEARGRRRERERARREQLERAHREERARVLREQEERARRAEQARLQAERERMRREELERERVLAEERARLEEVERHAAERSRRRRGPARRGVLIALAGLLVALSAGVGVWKGYLEVAVPDGTGASAAAATSRIAAAGLRPVSVASADCAVENGHVIGSDPLPGRRVPRGSVVRLAVSSSQDVVLPTLTGKPVQAASAQAAALGLTFDVAWIDSPGRPYEVVRTQPAAGTRVCTGTNARLFAVRGRPVDVVRGFYDAINAHDYATAYDYLNATRRSQQPFDDFQRGFGDTQMDELLALTEQGAGPDSTTIVFIRFVAHHTDGTTRTYAGTYQVGIEAGHWVIGRGVLA
jgi:CHAT domain/PASTA domain